jgi:MoxR-like ATPase
MVMATQNPIEQEGTYPLPEAQVDRFMLKVLVGYPTPKEERKLVDRFTGSQIPAGKQSLTFSIEYRDPARTLVAAEVDERHRAIGQALATQFQAQLR